MKAWEDRILLAQDAALARLRAQDFAAMTLGFVHQVLSSPRRPPAPVDPDFWRQFRLAEELDEIRQTRPSAFHALPQERRAGPIADVGYRA